MSGESGAAAGEGAIAVDVTADKAFAGRVALAGATLTVRRGTVHAVVGENGAGKTTLLKVVFGLVRADRGSLAIDGATVDLARHTPAAARARGVGMVQQHGALVPSLSVVENAVLGRENGAVLALDAPAKRLAAIADEVKLAVDPRAIVEQLPVAVRQRAEIVGELAGGAEVLILDEPTAVLAPVEVEGLLATLRALRASGKTVVLVTHKLDEVRAIADDITVLRAGKTVATFAGDAPTVEVARAMVGGALPPDGPALAPVAAGARVALSVRRLAAGALKGVDLEVKAGEIVGVAGVEGNGQTELAAAIAGLLAADGDVTIGGVRAALASVAQRQGLGLAHVPEDRLARGLVLDATVADNLVLGRRDLAPRFWRTPDTELAAARAAVADYDIRPPDPAALAGSLSGGNQQKLVVARELDRPNLVAVVAAQPTRGVDLGAVAMIHRRLRAVAADGAGVLVVSADLDELLALCHRVVVLYRGKVVGETRPDAPGARDQIGAWMTGAESPRTGERAGEKSSPGPIRDPATGAGTSRPSHVNIPDGPDVARKPRGPVAQEVTTAIVAALLVLGAGSLLMLMFGQSPWRVWSLMIARTLGDASSIGDVLDKATVLAFTGLATALALDAGLFNIGVEGQMVAGLVACGVTGAALPGGTPAVIAIPLCLMAAAAAGGAIGALTGWLRAARNAHEVITGIMLTAVIEGGVLWLGNSGMFVGGTTRTGAIAPGAQLPELGLGGSAASVAVLIALAVAGGVWLVRARSHWGARWRAVGASPDAAETLGVPVRRVRILIMTASGAIAGLAATGLVMGHQHAFEEGLGRGYGYLGVAVGLLGRRHPAGVVISALALGFLSQGGLQVADLVPKELTELLIGLAVLAVAIAAPLVKRLGGRA